MAKKLGVLYHRGAAQTSVGAGTREFGIRVGVERNIGASRPRQFCAWAWIPKGGHARRKGGLRAGDRACASTPTVAAKRAVRMLLRRNWY